MTELISLANRTSLHGALKTLMDLMIQILSIQQRCAAFVEVAVIVILMIQRVIVPILVLMVAVMNWILHLKLNTATIQMS